MYDLQAAQNSYLAQALPMVSHALSDSNVQIIRRAMDASWGYETEIPQLNPGFNLDFGQVKVPHPLNRGEKRSIVATI